MKIIFIKHGKSSFSTDKLTLLGKLQMSAVKKQLKNESIDAIFCAPETRTLQSAKMLSTKFNKPLYIIKEFAERTPLSPDKQEMIEEFQKYYLSYNYENENFETCNKYLNRVFVGIEQILSQENELHNVIIVAHSSTLQAINTYINGLPKDKQVKWIQLSHGAIVKFIATKHILDF